MPLIPSTLTTRATAQISSTNRTESLKQSIRRREEIGEGESRIFQQIKQPVNELPACSKIEESHFEHPLIVEEDKQGQPIKSTFNQNFEATIRKTKTYNQNLNRFKAKLHENTTRKQI